MPYCEMRKGQVWMEQAEQEYNAIARKIMEKNKIAVDDLYSFALPRLAEIQQPANVHFTSQGSSVLAKQVVASIESGPAGHIASPMRSCTEPVVPEQ